MRLRPVFLSSVVFSAHGAARKRKSSGDISRISIRAPYGVDALDVLYYSHFAPIGLKNDKLATTVAAQH